MWRMRCGEGFILDFSAVYKLCVKPYLTGSASVDPAGRRVLSSSLGMCGMYDCLEDFGNSSMNQLGH